MRKKEANILIVDDDSDILFSAKVWLKRFFTQVMTAESPNQIKNIIKDFTLDVVLLDMNYRKGLEDGNEGLYWLDFIQEVSPQTVVILMTGFGDVALAVESLKKGAFDFILKPWNNEKLYASVNAAVDLSRKNQKLIRFEAISRPSSSSVFEGKSAQMKSVFKLSEKVAKTDATVLILGENGTGKFVMAMDIFQKSKRKENPFVHVDLGSLNENLFESELFGYAKGAFTGAEKDTPGRFELADGGTIFLDEIGNLSLPLQAKLLTVLQSQKINRLGETKERKIDVRVICATNAPIYQMVKDGNFRQDLLYRINTVEITIPPLRERKVDIIPLSEFLLEKLKSKYRKPDLYLNGNAKTAVESYSWPGNIREMENVLERAVILAEGSEMDAYDLHFSQTEIHSDSDNRKTLEEVEKEMILKSLSRHAGNISKTAEELGITRAALYRRLEKFDLN
ncbi:MAG: sigma-54 dependent transcriptional regulator [Weeksellaceae bacterium]